MTQLGDARVSVARHALDALNDRNPEQFLELFDDAVTVRCAGVTVLGRRALRRLTDDLLSRCRTLQLELDDVAPVASGVVLVLRGRAVLNGARFHSTSCTEVDLEACAVLGFTGSLITRCSLYWSDPDVVDAIRTNSGPPATDQVEILQLVARYAQAVDRKDFDTVRACFTPDATAEYNGVEFAGIDKILDYIAGVERYPATQHIFGPSDIRVAGDTATVSSHAISHIVMPGESGDRLMSRGLTYHDELERTSSGWRIARRVHRPHWGTVAEIDWGGWPPGHTGPEPRP